jgi:metal-sulfur cluster biosynthetic enzyme
MTPATTAPYASASAHVLEALGEVHDPELDEPITSLGFVSACEVSPDGDVQVALRLPTPQCAPNFAFLMAADARAAVRRLPWVTSVTVRLEDHYTGGEINAAIRRGSPMSRMRVAVWSCGAVLASPVKVMPQRSYFPTGARSMLRTCNAGCAPLAWYV